MNLAGRLLLLVVIIDSFLYFGLTATHQPEAANFGTQASHFVNVNGTPNEQYAPQNLVSVNSTGAMVPTSSQTLWSFSAIVSAIFGFISLMFEIAIVPFSFMVAIQAPTFIQVVVGGAYMIMAIIAVVQLISGRSA